MLVARGPVDVDGERDDSDGDGETANGVDGSVVVDDTQRRRSRFRTQTSAGEEVGVVVEEARVLSPGDLLETDDGRLLVVELESTEALVVDLPSDGDLAAMVAVGHAIGNKHWDLARVDGRVYVPTGGEPDHRRAFLRSWIPEEAEIRVEGVEPTVFDESHHNAHSHSHGANHDHTHAHDDGSHANPHGHDHAHGGDHAHNHAHDGGDLTLDDVRRAVRGGDADE